MNFVKIFNAVQEEFDTEIAVTVNSMISIHLSQYPTNEEFVTPDMYINRIKSLMKDTLWETSDEVYDLALRIWDRVHDYERGESMAGLGGCEKKTFKELLEIK